MRKDLFRELSVRLLFKPFWKTGLSANKITALNFIFVGLPSVVLLALGYELLGLLIAGISAMIDYVDGTVARAGRGSPNGAYLDTSLDWLWLMLIIGAISYHNNIMTIGFIALVALTFGNWVQYNGKVDFKLPFPIGVSHLIVIGILTNNADLGITGVMLTQSIRTAIMYRRSLWNT